METAMFPARGPILDLLFTPQSHSGQRRQLLRGDHHPQPGEGIRAGGAVTALRSGASGLFGGVWTAGGV